MLFTPEHVAWFGKRKYRWLSSAPTRVAVVGCNMDHTSQTWWTLVFGLVKRSLLILTVRAEMWTCLTPSSMGQSGLVPLDQEELSGLRLAATRGLHLE